ncbi:MAG: hypothetical protein ACO3DJ_09225 [Alphaproteobacteria bacterium]
MLAGSSGGRFAAPRTKSSTIDRSLRKWRNCWPGGSVKESVVEVASIVVRGLLAALPIRRTIGARSSSTGRAKTTRTSRPSTVTS